MLRLTATVAVFATYVLPDAVVCAGDNGINWETVGLTWFLCTVTTALILLILCVVRVKCFNRKKRAALEGKSADQDAESGVARIYAVNRDSVSSRQRMLPPSRQTSRTDETTLGGTTVGSRSGQNRQSARDVDEAQTRRKTDITARWCTEKGLSEHTAAVLRKNGFQTLDALEALTVDVVSGLGFQNLGQECLLRQLVAQMERARNCKRGSASSSESRSPRVIISDGVRWDRNEPYTPVIMAPLMESTNNTHLQSEDVPDSAVFKYDGVQVNGHNGGEDQTDGQPVSSMPTRTMNGKKSNVFNGLLSDKGLYELGKQIGSEWLHLAPLLGVPQHAVERLRLDNPNNTTRQIAEMLRIWRDSVNGTKEQVKGQLYDALLTVERNDVGERLMAEQVEGSPPRPRYLSVV